VRLRKGYRFWVTLLAATCLIIPSVCIASLFVEWRTAPIKQSMNPDLWGVMPFVMLPLIFLFVGFRILIGHRGLLMNGEISIGKVVDVRPRRRGPEVTYEFLDRSGRLVVASSPDDTHSFSPGMVVPIFYALERPERDQVALCGSIYEIAG